jgi:hypothetical protein
MSDSSSISSNTAPLGGGVYVRFELPMNGSSTSRTTRQHPRPAASPGGAAKHLTLVPADYRALLKASEVQGAT